MKMFRMIFLLLLLAGASSLRAQDDPCKGQPPGQCTQGQTRPDEVVIFNYENVSVTFDTSCDERESWGTYTLNANSNGSYWCEDNKAALYIRIITSIAGEPTKQVQYQLPKETKYRIYWDANRRLWDISRLGPR
jgi:hypothetical protein